jgi:hypothetical protein
MYLGRNVCCLLSLKEDMFHIDFKQKRKLSRGGNSIVYSCDSYALKEVTPPPRTHTHTHTHTHKHLNFKKTAELAWL